MLENAPCGNLTLALIFTCLILVLSLTTMILSILQKKSYDSTELIFKLTVPLINNDKDVYKTFLKEIYFDNTTLDNYALTGEKYYNCFDGACYSRRNHKSINCSEACSLFISHCFADDFECKVLYCSKTNTEPTNNNTVCYNYNEINLWKGIGMRVRKINYYFSQLKDTVPYNESCREGFKQCGYLNREKDKLCVTLYESCPINKIILKDDNIPPTDFNYTMRQMGDKYLFYTNENINNTLYQSIYAETEIGPSYIDVQTGINTKNYTEVLDTQPITDFLNENSHIYDGKYPKSAEELSKYGDAKLLLMENTNDSLEELKKLQKIYLEKLSLYTDEKLNEMNEGANSYKNLLFGFNFVPFIYTCLIGIVFLILYLKNFIDFNEITPVINILIFLLGLSPDIFFNVYSFILVTIRKSNFNQYKSMDYIDDYIYCDSNKENCYFNDICYYNNALFICYIIGFTLIILYILIIVAGIIYENHINGVYGYNIQNSNQKINEQPKSSVEMKSSGVGEALVSASTQQ